MALFNIGMTEILLLLVIAFVVVGPQDLPKIARALGRFVRYIRQLIREVKQETGFDEVSAELRGISREIREDLRSADIRQDLREARDEIQKDLKSAEDEINQGLKSAKDAANLEEIEKEIKKE